MSFEFERWEYRVWPTAYINVVKGKNGNQDMCVFDVWPLETPINPPAVVLGLGFLWSYDIIFDADNKQIGLYTTDPSLITDH